jgi:hypothetical protein
MSNFNRSVRNLNSAGFLLLFLRGESAHVGDELGIDDVGRGCVHGLLVTFGCQRAPVTADEDGKADEVNRLTLRAIARDGESGQHRKLGAHDRCVRAVQIELEPHARNVALRDLSGVRVERAHTEQYGRHDLVDDQLGPVAETVVWRQGS